MTKAKTVKVWEVWDHNQGVLRDIPVLAWVGPYLCVTPTLGINSRCKYAVTHAGSGGAVLWRHTRKAAIAAAERLAKLDDWSWTAKTWRAARRNAKAMKNRMAIEAIANEVGA